MNQKISLLIIDNRPMVIQGIKSTLLFNKFNPQSICIDVANSYKNAIDNIYRCVELKKYYDIILIDIDLKNPNTDELIPFEEFISTLKMVNSNSKIITIIREKDIYRISNIFKTYNPEGFIVENELNLKELKLLIDSVSKCIPYYSKTIATILKKNKTNAFNLDDLDRKILYLLSKGIKTKNLTKHISRSLSTLEKRKQRIKELLVFDSCSDEKLLKEAFLQEII